MFYLKCFFIYSILGFLFETIISVIKKNNFSSGILYLPWTPIYGIGAVIILLLSDFVFKNLYFSLWKEIVIVFLLVTIVLSFVELIGGFLIEKFLNVIFWNYYDYEYHIGKYIAVEVSLVWGFLSLILIYIVHPFVSKFIILIPDYCIYILIILLFIDFVFTVLKYKKNK